MTVTPLRANRLGEESIPYLLLTFSLPAIVGMMAQGVYNVVDRIFVGHALGPVGLAGITVSLPYMLILMACAMLVGVGAAALVSLRLGQQKHEQAEQVLGNALLLLVAISALLTVLGLLCLDLVLKASGASPEVLPYARDYLRIIILGTVFQMLGFGLNAIIRAEGAPGVAMCTLLIGVLLNVALAPLFIFRFQWGMQGAALATLISQAVSAAWVVAYFLGRRNLLKLRLSNLRLRWPVSRETLVIGSPLFAVQVAGSVMNSLINRQLSAFGGSDGDLAISVMGILYSVAMIVAMPVFGINQGAQPIIGFNYGACRYDRVKQTLLLAILAASTLAVLGFVVAMAFPTHVIWLFNRSNASLAELGTHAIRTSMIVFPIIGFQIVASGYFLAVGKPRYAILLSLSRQVLVLIPTVMILPHFLGLDGVWLALPTADFLSSLATGTCLFWELKHLDRRHAETRQLPGTEIASVEEWVNP